MNLKSQQQQQQPGNVGPVESSVASLKAHSKHHQSRLLQFSTSTPSNSISSGPGSVGGGGGGSRHHHDDGHEDGDDFYTPEEHELDGYGREARRSSAQHTQELLMDTAIRLESMIISTTTITTTATTPGCPFPNETTTTTASIQQQQESEPLFAGPRQLTPELIARAEQEVNEKDSWRLRDIEALRDMIVGEKSLKSRIDDSFLLRFLRARRFDYDGAFQLLCDYYRLPRTNPELFPALERLKPVFDAHVLARASGRSSRDEAVFLLRLGRWEPRKFTFDDILAALIRLMSLLIEEDEVTQINGIVPVIDMAGFGWSHLRKFGPTLAKKCIFIMEKCLPVRIKHIYVCHESTLADIGFAIMRPFMSEELHEKIQFCGSTLRTTVHAHIPPEVLPVEFGGLRAPLDSGPLYRALEEFEWAKSNRESGQTYGFILPRRTSVVAPGTPTKGNKCAPSCGRSSSGAGSSMDEPMLDSTAQADLEALGPIGEPLGASPNTGTDMKSLFRKSQTCNGYLFDYYNSSSSVD